MQGLTDGELYKFGAWAGGTIIVIAAIVVIFIKTFKTVKNYFVKEVKDQTERIEKLNKIIEGVSQLQEKRVEDDKFRKDTLSLIDGRFRKIEARTDLILIYLAKTEPELAQLLKKEALEQSGF